MQAMPLIIWLKAVPLSFFGSFSSVVHDFGMTRSTTDHSVFYHHMSSEHLFDCLCG